MKTLNFFLPIIASLIIAGVNTLGYVLMVDDEPGWSAGLVYILVSTLWLGVFSIREDLEELS